MAMQAIDVRQMRLVTEAEAPVVARAKRLTGRKAPKRRGRAIVVSTWSHEKEKAAKRKLVAMAHVLGSERLAERLALDPDRVRGVVLGRARVDIATGERVLAADEPEAFEGASDEDKARADEAFRRLLACVGKGKRLADLLGTTQSIVADWADGSPLSFDGVAALKSIDVDAVEAEGKPESREQRRARRKRAVRAKTISVKRMTKREIELGRLLYPETDYERPKTRGDCERLRGRDENGRLNVCPYVSCAHHLYVDVNPRTGSIKMNFPDLEVEDMVESCSLDVADRMGTTLEEVGAILNLTRERIRQLETRAMAKVKANEETYALRDFADEGSVGKRRLPVLQVVRDDEDESDETTDEGEE